MNDNTRKFLATLGQEQLLGTIPSGLFLVDDRRHIVYWNREAERITGYPAAEAIGRHCSFLEGIECGRGCGLFDEGAPPKPVVGAECRIRTRDGRQVVIAKNIDYLRHGGDIVGGIESFVDITAQKGLEEKLRRHGAELEETVRQRTADLEEERSRLRSVLDAMKDPAYIVTDHFRIVYANRAMRKLFGTDSGAPCHAHLHGSDTPCEGCPWPQIRRGEVVNEERTFGQNGRSYDIVHTPVYTSRGELQKLAVCRDVTERREATDKLMELNRHLDSFVYTVSHDLRSPLTPIIGFAEFLREEYRDKLDPQAINLLREIENQGGRMLNLMEDLLALSRVGHLPRPSDPVDLGAVVDRVIEENRGELEAKGVTVDVGPLPALMIPEALLCDMIGNLLVNALRYGCEQGGSIAIGSDRESAQPSFYVRDRGPGIAEKEREKVCNVFFRGSTAGDIPGTGIGLATVHKIARLYDGSIRIGETPGGGCTIHVTFPAK